MKKILLSLAAMGAIAASAAPAAAQSYRHGGYDRGYDRGYDQSYQAPYQLTTPYVDGLDWKITNAAQEGRISWGEARQLRAEFRSVQPIAWRVQTGQANRWETERLERAVSHIDRAVSGYGRYDQGRYARYDRDGWRR